MEKKVLVAGPYVGELGWELFSWQPLVRAQYLMGDYSKCIVYTGPGRSLLYRFAEVRTLPNVPNHESECLVWHNLPNYKKDLDGIISEVSERSKKEFGANFALFSYSSLPALNQPFYEKGLPDLLRPRSELTPLMQGTVRKLIANRKTVVCCVRDRQMSNYRNLDYEDWYNLAAELLESEKCNVIFIGLIRDRNAWELPEGTIDLTGKTTIDDCVDLFCNYTTVAVGGSTGLLHLASRCGTDHLVWSVEKVVLRNAESNWFGANCKTYLWGWQPEVEDISKAVLHFVENGEFL